MTIKPLEGHALIKLEVVEHITGADGSIILPAIVEHIAGHVGIVEKYTPITSDVCRLWHKGKLRTFDKWQIDIINKQAMDIIGKRVYFETGKLLEIEKVQYSIVRVEHITAELPEQGTIDIGGGLPRCPRCKSVGEKNILMDDKGYCYKCGLNKEGRTKSEVESRFNLNGSEEWEFGNKGIADRNKEKQGIAVEGKIMSSPHISKRSGLRVK